MTPKLIVGVDSPPAESCHHIVRPWGKGNKPYYCRYDHHKGGWCWQHHPDEISKRAAREQNRVDRSLAQTLNLRKALDDAILLLVEHGYRVEKVSTPVPASILNPNMKAE